MAFNIKEGVYGTLHDAMFPALQAVQAVWRLHNLGIPTITSIEDGQHMQGSKHEQGLAFDIRLNNISFNHEQLRLEVLRLAGDDLFDVVHEYHGTQRDHLHIEYDPKY